MMARIWTCAALLGMASSGVLVAPAAAQRDGAPAAEQATWTERLSRHESWLKGLGNPILLDVMGLSILQDAQRADPRRLSLPKANLRRLQLPGAVLKAAVLTHSNLRGAVLDGADISHALLSHAILARASLVRVRLVRAELGAANLRGADLAGADLTGAQMAGADLRGANLIGATLSDAYLAGANLTEANLSGAKLNGADLSQADMSGADLHQADLSFAQLFQADLRAARMTRTTMDGAQLYGTDFRDAYLVDSALRNVDLTGAMLGSTHLFSNDLAGTDLRSANLAGVIFEPPPERLQAIAERLNEFTRASNLGLMTFLHDSTPLASLRRLMRLQGYDREVLEITYAIRRGQRRQASAEGTPSERLVGLLQLLFVELPIEYGAAPFRPLLLVVLLIAVFGLVYMVVLVFPSPYWGELWRITPRDPFARRMSDTAERRRLEARSVRDLPVAIWFSVLSALNIGGRVFNVDDLFINCQREEYYLRATGWVRAISGIQALGTLYLLGLTLLIFFEKVTF